MNNLALTLLLRPDRGRSAYRLRCRFKVNAFPNPDFFDKAKFQAAEMFVRDMKKQGWTYLDKHGFKVSGPYAPLVPVSLPHRHLQAQWHTASRDLLPQIQAGRRFHRPKEPGYVSVVPSLIEMDEWEFELAGVFVHSTILTEIPDAHEERQELRAR